jgi:hypothetical protein
MKKLLLLITALFLLISVEGQILRYSNYTTPTPPTVLVESISVWGTGGATTISTNGGTLQMLKKTLPTNAADTSVTWSRTNGTGTANISAGGLLTALTNGTVTARATANDGSAVYGEEVITISNQSTNLVYNGTFDSADGWNTSGTMTITGGQLVWSSSSPYGICIQLDIPGGGPMTPLATSTGYTLSFEVISYSGGGGAWIKFANSNNTVTYVDFAWYGVGVHNVNFTTPGTLDVNGLRILINNDYGCTAAVIDNISIVLQ